MGRKRGGEIFSEVLTLLKAIYIPEIVKLYLLHS
jgi:hypothetical protein